jgi:hypothetical protein
MPFPIPVTFFKAGTTTTTTTTTTTVAPLVIGGGYSASVLTPSRIQTSSNGTSWALQNTINSSCTAPSDNDTASIQGGAYAPSLGLWALTLGSGSVITSTTATTSSWTVRTTPFTGCGTPKYNYRMTWAASLGLFVAVHQSSLNPITSPDGINWTSRTGAGTGAGWKDIVWAASISTFVAIQANASSQVLTSTNGTTWTARNVSGASKSFNAIAWSPSLVLFVAVGGNTLQTSPDGITWTNRTAYNAEDWNTISWSPTLSLFVAGSDAARSKLISSPDGINWTWRYEGPSNGYIEFGASVWSPALAIFIFAGYPGTRGFTSTNGTTWTERTLIDTLYCRDLIANS